MSLSPTRGSTNTDGSTSADAGVIFDKDGQMVLLSSAQLGEPLFSEDERKGKYTGDRLKSCYPDKYQLIVSMLAEGLSFGSIRRATGCHMYTIKAVFLNEPRLIEQEKQRTSNRYKLARTITAEKILEGLDSLEIKNATDLQKLTIVGGILTDKAELLSGGPTHRIAKTEERLEDVVEHFNNLPGGSDVLEADFQEITGFDGEAPTPKEQVGPAELKVDGKRS